MLWSWGTAMSHLSKHLRTAFWDLFAPSGPKNGAGGGSHAAPGTFPKKRKVSYGLTDKQMVLGKRWTLPTCPFWHPLLCYPQFLPWAKVPTARGHHQILKMTREEHIPQGWAALYHLLCFNLSPYKAQVRPPKLKVLDSDQKMTSNGSWALSSGVVS